MISPRVQLWGRHAINPCDTTWYGGTLADVVVSFQARGELRHSAKREKKVCGTVTRQARITLTRLRRVWPASGLRCPKAPLGLALQHPPQKVT